MASLIAVKRFIRSVFDDAAGAAAVDIDRNVRCFEFRLGVLEMRFADCKFMLCPRRRTLDNKPEPAARVVVDVIVAIMVVPAAEKVMVMVVQSINC